LLIVNFNYIIKMMLIVVILAVYLLSYYILNKIMIYNRNYFI